MVFLFAACGQVFDNVFIRDLGDGTCAATFIVDNGVTIKNNTCDSPIFPDKTCTSFAGTVSIFMANEKDLTNVTYVQPNIQLWLDSLGIGRITVLGGALRVFVDQTPVAVPTLIAPFFYSSLRQAGALFVSECINCAANPNTGPIIRSVLTGLPGLTNLYQLRNLAQPDFNLFLVQFTAFKNFTSLSGLVCPPPVISFPNNTQLTSLAGFEQIATPGPAGIVFLGLGSGPFTQPNAFDAIKVLSGCFGTPTGSFVQLPVGCSVVLSTSAQVCAFQGSPAFCPPR
jgi:hypothetical protein